MYEAALLKNCKIIQKSDPNPWATVLEKLIAKIPEIPRKKPFEKK